jgi:hypothetical protein
VKFNRWREREPDSLMKSGEEEEKEVWMDFKVEMIVKGGKNGDPISHWRPGSFFISISLGHNIFIVSSSVTFSVAFIFSISAQLKNASSSCCAVLYITGSRSVKFGCCVLGL